MILHNVRPAGGHVQLIADRFALDDRGHAIDLATGERVCLLVSTAGGPTEQARWAERCAWLSALVHPSLAQLVDFGVVGDTQRFEAWGAQPGWRGAAEAAQQAVERAARVLIANGRSPVSSRDASVGSRAGRPVIVPDPAAGMTLRHDAETSAGLDDGRELLGVVRQPDCRLAPVAEIFPGRSSGRVVAVAVWAPEGGGAGSAVCVLARAARLAGCVPVSTSVFDRSVRELLRGRTLVLIARHDVDEGWRSAVDASLDCARPHIVLFAGAHAVRRVHTVSLERWQADALVSSVCPPSAAKRHMRHVSTAARRSQGLRGRFEQLLLGDVMGESTARAVGPPARIGPRRNAGHGERGAGAEVAAAGRAAETASAVEADTGDCRPDADVSRTRSWPAPGELARLRRQLESVRALLSRGRYQPGERGARQAMHAFARRGEWASAAESAVLLAYSLARRGRHVTADGVLDTARPWATQARDLRLLQDVAMLRARLQTESGRLADAESVLETVLASALSAGNGVSVDATLALSRCLYWQGRFSDAWQRLALAQPEAEGGSRDTIRLGIARSRVLIGRGRGAEAVADAARARDCAIALNDASLCGAAFYACALAQLAVGDATQADSAASMALETARRAHEPMLALCVRVLRAEIARRQGQRGPATLLVKRMNQVPASAIPSTVRARIDLLRDLLSAVDPVEASERRADASGLPALRLFAPAPPPSTGSVASAADDIIELLRCCQVAEEDAVVLTSVCARLRGRLQAVGVAFFAAHDGEVVCVAGDGARVDAASARRVVTANQLVLPHHGGERVEAGVPVRYAGRVVGALVANWTPAVSWHPSDVSILLSTGATAAGPALSGLLGRRAGEQRARASELLGVGTAIADVRAAIERAASAPFAVLVEGGTRRELASLL